MQNSHFSGHPVSGPSKVMSSGWGIGAVMHPTTRVSTFRVWGFGQQALNASAMVARTGRLFKLIF